MKLHHHLAEAVVAGLSDVFAKTTPADRVLERLFKAHPKWGARDRRFVAESLYDMVRWWRWLWWVLELPPSHEPLQLWKLVAAWLAVNRAAELDTLPPWPEFENLDFNRLRARSSRREAAARAEQASLPDWLYQRGEQECGGTAWPELLDQLNAPAPVFLRANLLKTTPRQLIEALSVQGVAVEAVSTGDGPPAVAAVRLRERKNVFITPAFKQGLFEVQDLHSQLVAPFLEVAPHQRVIDACAGAGGKTLHLATLMNNRGRVLALDIQPQKLAALKLRARRAGVNVVEPRLIASSKTLKRLEGTADRLLLDVPCSGLGVLRRNPDTKWRLTADELRRVAQLQAEILERYSRLVKPGGKMVYATCSILPSENERQVERFLEKEADRWELEETRRLPPKAGGGDGFFMARWVRRPEE